MEWARDVLATHGLAVFIVVVMILFGVAAVRAVWRYVTQTFIPDCFGSLKTEVASNGSKIEGLRTDIGEMRDALEVNTALQLATSETLPDDRMREKLALARAYRKIANGG